MRLPDYKEDRKWSDTFIPEIRRVLTENAHKIVSVEVASNEADIHRATDFQVKAKTGDIACRIRRSKYTFRDWTIRYSRPSGAKTEYAKLLEGNADFYLYAWADTIGFIFKDWLLIDLNLVRIENLLAQKWDIETNRDGTRFMSIPWDKLGRCLLASSMELPTVPDDPKWYDENALHPLDYEWEHEYRDLAIKRFTPDSEQMPELSYR